MDTEQTHEVSPDQAEEPQTPDALEDEFTLEVETEQDDDREDQSADVLVDEVTVEPETIRDVPSDQEAPSPDVLLEDVTFEPEALQNDDVPSDQLQSLEIDEVSLEVELLDIDDEASEPEGQTPDVLQGEETKSLDDVGVTSGQATSAEIAPSPSNEIFSAAPSRKDRNKSVQETPPPTPEVQASVLPRLMMAAPSRNHRNK